MEKNNFKSDQIILNKINNNSVVVDHFSKKFKDINIGPLSFVIEKGKVTAILGSSGSGKSVFLNSLLGATLNYNGKIFINGIERKKSSSIENNSNVGFYSQMDFSLYVITAYEFLYNMCNVMGFNKTLVKSRIEYWLKKFDLWSYKDKPLNSFSWGMKNRMNLILCFIKEPEILILDEPGANLDSKWRGQSYKILKEFKEEFNSTIILTVHNIDEVYNIIENFVILEKGKLLFSGSKNELNLYKKINVLFEKDVALAEVEKLLNEHNILTFNVDLVSNSLVIGLRSQQTFNDALFILEKKDIKPKDVIPQVINMDAIQKALEDKTNKHKPKYEPLKEFTIENFANSNSLKNTLEFLNKIEDKYQDILKLNEDQIKVNLSNDLILLGEDFRGVSEKKDDLLISSEITNQNNDTLTSSEIKVIKKNFFDKIQEIKDLKTEINKMLTEQKTEINLNIDDLKDYFAKIKLESEIIHQVKTNFENESANLKILLEKTEVETKDLDYKKNELQIKLNDLKKLKTEIDLTSSSENKKSNKIKNELQIKLEDTKKIIEGLKNSITNEIEIEISEFKNFENQFNDLVFNQKEIIQNKVKDFEVFLNEIHTENNEINDSKKDLKKDLTSLKKIHKNFLVEVNLENKKIENKKIEFNEKINDLNKLQVKIDALTIEKYKEINVIKSELKNKIQDLKHYINNIGNETKIIEKAKLEYLKKIKEFKKIQNEFNKSSFLEKENLQKKLSELKNVLSQIQSETNKLNLIKNNMAKNVIEDSASINESNLEIIKIKEELNKLNHEMNMQKQESEKQNSALLLKTQELEKIKLDLNKEKEYFEQLRKKIIFEKNNEKLLKFNSEIQQRQNTLKIGTLRPENQKEKLKLNESLLIQKLNK